MTTNSADHEMFGAGEIDPAEAARALLAELEGVEAVDVPGEPGVDTPSLLRELASLWHGDAPSRR